MLSDSALESPRLRLRNLRTDDIGDTYLSWLRDPEVNRFLEVRFTEVKDRDEIVAFAESVNASRNAIMFGIFVEDGERHIGNIKLGPIIWNHARAEVGFMIGDKTCWNKGYASEAIRTIVRYGFDVLGLARVTSGCYETNVASSKALLKAGFVHEATLPSDVICEGRRVASYLYGINRYPPRRHRRPRLRQTSDTHNR